MHSSVRRPPACVAAMALLGLMLNGCGTSAGDRRSASMRVFETGLLPAVVIHGDPVDRMRLDDRMKYYHVPALSVALIKDGRIAWARAWGVSDTATGKPATTQTRFMAGSVSKSVTAFGVLRLAMEGKLQVDNDVNEALKSWHVPQNEFTSAQAVTVRELLGHTAGVGVHGFGCCYPENAPLPTLKQILDGVPPAQSPPIRVEVRPGTEFRYSGGGYCILQQLLIDVTGQSFPDLMERVVLGPLHMNDSTFAQPRESPSNAERATGYDMRGMPMPFGLKWPTQPEMAPAGLWTTPTDLAKVAIEVGKALSGESRLLSRDWARAMVHAGLGDWGLGWQIYKEGGFERFGHGGEVPGFVASIDMSMDGRNGFVIMANRDTARGLLIEASNALAKELGWPIGPTERTATKLPTEQLATVVGRYSFGPEHVAEIVLRGDKLFWNLDMEEWRLYPQSSDDFFTLQPGAPTFHFIRSSDGKVGSVVAHLLGMQFTGQRVP